MIRTSVAGALGIVAALAGIRACPPDREAGRPGAGPAGLRTEAAQERIRAVGYQAVLARVADDLRAALEERDHWRALAREADAEPVALVDAEATVEARIETPAAADVDSGRYEGEYADSVFWLRWGLLLGPPARFSADLRARLPLELVGYRLPDGSYGVTAESPDPRVRIEVEDFYWQPPKQPGPSRWKWLLAGVAIGAVGWEMVR